MTLKASPLRMPRVRAQRAPPEVKKEGAESFGKINVKSDRYLSPLETSVTIITYRLQAIYPSGGRFADIFSPFSLFIPTFIRTFAGSLAR